MKLLGVSGDAKTIKGEKLNYLTAILYLAPSTVVKGIDLCKFASKGCKKACLFTAGRGKFSNVMEARKRKTKLFRDNREEFITTLVLDIIKFERKAKRKGMTPVIRLNGTSDINWLEIDVHKGETIFEVFSNITFYDYTKSHSRLTSNKHSNYHLTYSYTEEKHHQVKSFELLRKGFNVAIVFDDMPETYLGYKVINGDENDLRFKDAKGVIVGLKAKGDAKKDTTGFVVKQLAKG